MYHGVKAVQAMEGHRLRLLFDNGEWRIFDVKPLLPIGRFSELASMEVFKTAKVSFDTVEWENGMDLDPEYLYERSRACDPQDPPA
ncbi:MAG: DUF2442 domain-containing protein [Acidobacteria bacterium]|nr:DUF2442 domain-containing protein [Acidobacteriota bacterium]